MTHENSQQSMDEGGADEAHHASEADVQAITEPGLAEGGGSEAPKLDQQKRAWILRILLAVLVTGNLVAWIWITRNREWNESQSVGTPVGLSALSAMTVDVDAINAATDRLPRTTTAQGHPNGFDVSRTTVPKDEILRGGPGRDGIPALLEPRFVSASEAPFLRGDDTMVGVYIRGHARAYPLRILVWHEIVNDAVEGVPILVTYCPLCGTAMVFSREIGEEVRTFGVSGLLYNSDVLMYDHQTESLWSQLKTEAISGPSRGTRLRWIPSSQMSWRSWKRRYPDTDVLSVNTGFRRNYGDTPYAKYFQQETTLFPVPKNRGELKTKEWVAGVVVDGVAKAYPISRLDAGEFPDTIGRRPVHVHYDDAAGYVQIIDAVNGDDIPSVQAYWFAWQAFYPATLLYGE